MSRASPRLATAINTWITQEWERSLDRISNDPTIEAFSRMSDQGFIGEIEDSSGVVIGEF
jgi:hypothetical protein